MKTELIITEKPKVANKMAYILGDGKAKRNVSGKVSYYVIETDDKKIIIAPAVGHLFSLTEKKKSYNYPVFDIEWVPNYEVSKSAYYTRNYLNLLQKLSKEADVLICACDYDIEGSLIGGNVYKFVYKRDGRTDAKRMKFSSLTSRDIKEAYENVQELDYGNIDAGETRHILDWYYGINLSRGLMGALKAAHGFRIMSVGRVQGPALEILSKLERKIKDFKPTPYWELFVLIKGIKFMHEQDRFLDESKAKTSLNNTTESAIIEKLDKKEKDMWALPPYDLTSLQIDAYRAFKYSPSKVLSIAQSLYENSYISYPRTASQKLPFKLGLKRIIEKIGKIDEYSKLVEKLLTKEKLIPMQGKKDDPAHPAIHPTGVKPAKLTKEENNLYDLIVRRFLACFGPKAVKEMINVVVDSNGEKYKASGSRLIEKGWIEYYGKYYVGKDVILPEFIEGGEEKIEDKQVEKKETKPPRRYSPATLISELEKKHLGTKATRATILDKLYERNYVVGSMIQVTDFGLEVEKILTKYAPEILDEELTETIHHEMQGIQDGKVESKKVIDRGKEIIEKILTKWKKNEVAIGKELKEALNVTEEAQFMLGDCNKCKEGRLKIIKLKFGKQFVGCTSYPNCRNAFPLPTGAFVKPTGKTCNKCPMPMIFVAKSKKRYSFCIDPNCPSKADWKKKAEEKAKAKETAKKETKTTKTKTEKTTKTKKKKTTKKAAKTKRKTKKTKE